jgi:drug/metabolite transporter (DMT)-like permease
VSESKTGVLPYLALIGLALIWGASFLFIKYGIAAMSPIVVVLFRSATGFLVLAAIVGAMRRPLAAKDWRTRIVSYLVMAIGGGVLPWTAIAWGEEHITSGLASILNATTPLWAAVLAYWVIPSERPSVVNYAGVFLGFAGVIILLVPRIAAEGLRGDTLGTLAVLGAAASYALVALYQRRKLRGVNPYEASLGQLGLTALVALPLAVPSLPAVHLDPRALLAVLALGAFGSGVAQILYYYMLNTLGPVRASAVTLLLPVTAVFWGVTLLQEQVSMPMIVGMVVILAGIVLTNLKRRAPQSQPAREQEAAGV